jgi:hypothetical protein
MSRKNRTIVRLASDLSALRPSEQEARARALDALSRVRQGMSLRRASFEAATTPHTVRRYSGSALRREGRRWRATKSDRLFRRMRWIVETDVITIDLTDSRTASRIASYWDAVKTYVETGNTQALRKFRGKTIRVQKRAYFFVTDTRVLDQLARRGELSFETIYSEVA